MKKCAIVIFAVFIMLIASVMTVQFTEVQVLPMNTASAKTCSGNCGDNAKWTLDTATGVLNITGNGDMADGKAIFYNESGYNYIDYVETPWSDYNNYIKEVNVAKGITSIGSYAFYGCNRLKSITLPAGVTSIGEYAFYDCTVLTDIKIPDSTTSIGKNAFCGCTGLTGIIIPDGITAIEDNTFFNCRSLASVTLPDSIAAIGSCAFANCVSLTGITVPCKVDAIGYNAFYNCIKLGKVDITDLEQWLKINFISEYSNPLSYAHDLYLKGKKLTEITVPNGISCIGNSVFYNCTGLVKITIPDSVTYIGESAFGGCSNLKVINIPDSITSVGRRAFKGCTGLISMKIPDSVTIIGDEAFLGCSGLKNITIPAGITFIGDSAFNKTAYYNDAANWNNGILYINKALIKANTSVSGKVSIKSGTKYIAEDAFSRCKKITAVTIADSVTTIGGNAFYECTGLTDITIPDSVTSVGDYAFEDCSGLKSVIVGKGVASIDYFVFAYCTGLTKVTISEGVKNIDENAFYGCRAISDITLPDSLMSVSFKTFENTDFYKNSTDRQDGILYINNILLKADTSVSGEIQVREGVTCIAGGAFYDCDKITGLTIPESVAAIGSYAFCGCEKLDEINIPDAVEYIGKDAFENTAVRNALADSSDGMLYLDKFLMQVLGRDDGTVRIKDGTVYIADDAFHYDKTYTEYKEFRDEEGDIYTREYINDVHYKNIVIPESVVSIGKDTFDKHTVIDNLCILNPACVIAKYAKIMAGTIYGIKDSTAQKYAADNNIRFVEIKDEHVWICDKVKKQSSCTEQGEAFYICLLCDSTKNEVIEKLGHSYKEKLTTASVSKAGKIEYVCARCGVKKSVSTIIPQIKSVSVAYKNYTYTGSEIKPTVTVKDSNGNKLKNGVDYTVKYSYNKAIGGKGSAKVTFMGKYSGTKTLNFSIVPGKVTGLKFTSTTDSVKLSWKAVRGAITYRIYKYNSTSKSYTRIASTKNTSYTFSKLSKGKTYTYYVTAGKTVNEKVYESSRAKAVTATKTEAPKTPTLTAGTKKVTVRWTKPAGTTGFELYMKKGSSGTYSKIYTGTKQTYTKTSLKTGSTYYFRVRTYKTVDGAKIYSAYSSAKSVKVR